MVPRGLKIYKNFDLSTLNEDDMLEQDLYGNKVVPIGGEEEGVWSTVDMLWHHDRAYSSDCHASVGLYCVAADVLSSPTYFIDMVTAYEEAPDWLKKETEDMVCTNSIRKYMEQAVYPHTFRTKVHERQHRMKSKADHPVVQSNQYGTFFFWSPAYTEIDPYLESKLESHCLQRKYQYIHYWNAGDMLIYDNKSILHKRDATPSHIDRRHLRYAFNTSEL